MSTPETGGGCTMPVGQRRRPCGRRPAEPDPANAGALRCADHAGKDDSGRPVRASGSSVADAARRQAFKEAWTQATDDGNENALQALRDAYPDLVAEAETTEPADGEPEAPPAPADALDDEDMDDATAEPPPTGERTQARMLLLELADRDVLPQLDTYGVVVVLEALERMVEDGWEFIAP